ncbi:hypothetical protein [Jidongwangia harbinensis]|uniref:hypothetical protein n=1 Tax=Jidongwangia harbinensis TaxID=2878561 RepID=UPI001CD98CF0|nr:hypothetical protein [Jidongwangia harbinensis]MCA2211927.1 hypothetical protein [Jidongwangia harbinensis]
MRIRTLMLTSATALGLALAPAVAPAQAAAAPVPGAGTSGHCVLDVSAERPAPVCFGSFTEAIARATGGRIADAPADAGTALKDARFRARVEDSNARGAGRSNSLADVLIGIEFEDSDFDDNEWVVTAAWGCTSSLADVDWHVAELGSYWNDQVGSYQTFSGCRAQHFEHSHFTGISMAYDTGRADMGWMDDEASSIRWS